MLLCIYTYMFIASISSCFFDLQLKMSRGTLTMLTQSCNKLILSGLAKEVDVANGI